MLKRSRKAISYYLLIAITLIILPSTASASVEADFQTHTFSPNPDEDFQAVILGNVDGFSGGNFEPFDVVEIILEYDASVVHLANTLPGSIEPGASFDAFYDADPAGFSLWNSDEPMVGKIIIGLSPIVAASNINGELATVTFHSTSGGNTEIKISSVNVSYSADIENPVLGSIGSAATVSIAEPDVIAPVLSQGLPSDILPEGITTSTISLISDENATCRYATSTSIDFSLMTNNFNLTNATNHSTLVSDLIGGSENNYYVRCIDEQGNVNNDDYKISFVVASTTPIVVDVSQLVLSQALPSGILPAGTTMANISLLSDENSICRYSSASSTTYASSSIFDMTGTTTHSTLLSDLNDGTTNNQYISCMDESGNINTDKLLITFIIASPVFSSGNSGGSSGGTARVANPVTAIENVSLPVLFSTGTAVILNQDVDLNVKTMQAEKKILVMMPESLIGASGEVVDYVTDQEAMLVSDQDGFIDLTDNEKILYSNLLRKSTKELTINEKYGLAYFIKSGTPTTVKMGAGERAGVVDSYLSVFEKIPSTSNEWQDVIKIANGRWTLKRNMVAEKNAQEDVFKKIYKRNVDIENASDNSAIAIIAYGLRPALRNIDSEKAALTTFKDIYKYNPSSAQDWDIVRTIAYSGAKR